MSELGTCLVTGGAGYLGGHLSRELLRLGYRVRVLDRAEPGFDHPRLGVVIGDVREPSDAARACEGVETVFHTAACFQFLRFARRAQRREAWSVNVGGTVRMLEAARTTGVRRFVHTSSNNVTFDDPVVNGDETLPYASQAPDLYTRTKIEGERLVLEADGRDGLHTCALRPAGIYGPGERMMLRSLYQACERGIYLASFGDADALCDNVYIDNAVDAHIAAAEHLEPDAPLCGEAYFISDGAPTNYFEFFRPLVEGVGYRAPRVRLPGSLGLGLAWTAEAAHRWLGTPRPFLCHHEMKKIVETHYNRIDKAKRDFGWQPRVEVEEAQRRTISYGRTLVDEIRSARHP